MDDNFIAVTKTDKFGILFVVSAIAVIIIFVYPYFEEFHITNYQFFTVSKIEGKYEQPVYLSFHWETEDEVITGKPVEVWVETQLPYDSPNAINPIEVEFEGIGYYDKPVEEFSKRISTVEKVILKSTDSRERMFKSEPIKIRYAVGGTKNIKFCDYNTSPPCTEVREIIEVAPRVTAYDISVAKLIFIGTIGVYILTVILVWITIRLLRYSQKSS